MASRLGACAEPTCVSTPRHSAAASAGPRRAFNLMISPVFPRELRVRTGAPSRQAAVPAARTSTARSEPESKTATELRQACAGSVARAAKPKFAPQLPRVRLAPRRGDQGPPDAQQRQAALHRTLETG